MPGPSAQNPLALLALLNGMNPFGDMTSALGEQQGAMGELEASQLKRMQAAAGAQQQYQDAAAVPPPGVTPLDTLPQAFSNFASVISRRPEYAQNAQQRTIQTRQENMAARAQNLQALRDNYTQLAEQAGKADPIAALKYQEKAERSAKALDQLHELGKFSRESQFKADQAALDRASQEKQQAMQAGAMKENRYASHLDQAINDVRQDPEIQSFIVHRDAFTTGMDAAKRLNSIGDMVLMRMIAKITDPSTGVKEEEFKTFEKAQGTLAKYGVTLTRDMWGEGKLNDKGRMHMKGVLTDIYRRKEVQYKRAAMFHKNRAKAIGVDPDLVMRDYTPEAIDLQSKVNEVNSRLGGQ